MDEIFGYFPPTAEPPSKKPLLTLLKQARAFGLGVLLATQNPVDLDYKGLSNAGTWLIGRLQTDQDKQRVLDGLEGASGQGGLDRAQLEKLISALGNRVFLLNNVHENAPEVFQTRWTMSYLRGPLSRPQIASLMTPLKAALPPPAATRRCRRSSGRASRLRRPPPHRRPAAVSAAATRARAAERRLAGLPAVARSRPGRRLAGLPADADRRRARAPARHQVPGRRGDRERTARGVRRRPDRDRLVGCRGSRRRARRISSRRRATGAPSTSCPRPRARPRPTAAGRRTTPTGCTRRRRCSSSAARRRSSCRTRASRRPTSAPRLAQGAREGRDSKADALRAKYDAKVAALQQKLHTAQQAVDREENQERGAGLQTAVSVAGSILGGFLGRKSVSVGSITSVARGAGRVAQQRDDVKRAEENVTLLQSQLSELRGVVRAGRGGRRRRRRGHRAARLRR